MGDIEFVRIWWNKDFVNFFWILKFVCMFNYVGIDKCFNDILDIIFFGLGKVEYIISCEFLFLCRFDIMMYFFDE